MSRKNNIVIVDARCAGYVGESKRVMAITLVDSGKVLVEKLADWHEPIMVKDNTLVVTDTPHIFQHWSLAFREQDNMKDLLKTYLEVKRSGLLKINEAMRMYDPVDIVQASKVDERGQILEFDAGITNGYMAVLLAIWGARRAYGGYVVTHTATQVFDNEELAIMLPFSV